MKYQIRTITPKDYTVIPQVYSESFFDEPWEDDWFKVPMFNPKTTWVLEINDQIIGFIISFVSNDQPYISVLAVKDTYKRMGFGTCLLRVCVDYWCLTDYKKIFIHVDHDRNHAKALYEKHGFKTEMIRNEDTYMCLEL